MNASDIRAFVARDWGRVSAAKDRHWIARRRQRGPADAVRVSAALWLQARQANPGWPSLAERKADLQSHQALAELMDRVASARD